MAILATSFHTTLQPDLTKTRWHLCRIWTHLNFAIVTVSQHWYLILLIQSFNIILRIFMFYKHRVVADFWGRKDSAVGINKWFIAHSMCTASNTCTAALATGTNWSVQNAKHKYTGGCWLIMFVIRNCVRYPIIGKYTLIMAKLRCPKLRNLHKCQIDVYRFWTEPANKAGNRKQME